MAKFQGFEKSHSIEMKYFISVNIDSTLQWCNTWSCNEQNFASINYTDIFFRLEIIFVLIRKKTEDKGEKSFDYVNVTSDACRVSSSNG